MFTIGPLGTNTTDIAGLDISPSGSAFALLHSVVDPVGQLYNINLTSGAATLVGAIAGEAPVVDIAVQAPTAVRMQSVSAVRTKRGVSVRGGPPRLWTPWASTCIASIEGSGCVSTAT